ncbi:MAG: vWA domain-containing protein [Planctomycetaceae bacterium]
MSAVDSADVTGSWWDEIVGDEGVLGDAETPAWLVSMLVHVAVLMLLAMVVVPPAQRPPAAIAIVQPVVEELELFEPEAIAVEVEASDQVGANSNGGEAVAESLAPVIADVPLVAVDTPEIVDSDVHIELMEEIMPVALALDTSLKIRGDSAVGTDGASGAVDRLTLEIAASLDKKDTMVFWVFDQSVSLAGQRRDIASRLTRVLEELDASGSRRRSELFHLIYAYGDRVNPVIDRPTRDGQAVVDAIESIPIDDSGVELTFTAVRTAARKAQEVRAGRNVMLVVFTDEVGNDEQLADETAEYCRRMGIRVYVVGVPAPFGRRHVEIKFVEFDQKYADGEVRWPVVDQGPETLYPELIKVASKSPADEPIDSGFGPFSLSKLCASTGGIYFTVHGSRGSKGRVKDAETAPRASRLRHFFESDAMRQYRPDYLSKANLDKELAANKAKKALVEAAGKSELQPVSAVQTEFPRRDDAQLSASFSEAQKEVARLQPAIDAIHRSLAAGVGDREKIREKRWQAGFDLAMGRVLAAKIRADAYNEVLGQAKSGLVFKHPDSDTWELAPSDELGAISSRMEKLAGEARTYLERVVADHPGTPWAYIASEELKVPLGYAWREKHTGVAKQMQMGANNNNPTARPDDVARKLMAPKPQRPLKNL